MLKRILGTVVLFLVIISVGNAQNNNSEPDPWIFLPNLRIWGADLGVGFRTPGKAPNPDTIFWLFLGSGYEWPTFYRDPDNHLYNGDYPGFEAGSAPYYTRFNLRADLGIAQGLLYNEKLKDNLLEAFLFYRVRYDAVLDEGSSPLLILSTDLPDRLSLYQNSLLLGLSLNLFPPLNDHLLTDGFYAELSFEWGPSFLQTTWLNPEAKPDFWRLNFQAKYFLTLFDLDPQSELNIFSCYLASFFSVDFASGNQVPINIQQTFGGRFARPGLGGSVRGFEISRFDGLLKAVLNSEIRFNLWQFKLLDTFTPGFLFFFDAGYYNFVYYPEADFIFSCGIGLYLNILRFTSITAYSALVMNRALVDKSYWAPFIFAFSAHF